MEDIDINKVFESEYNDTVKNAVRYGYQYRIMAEQNTTISNRYSFIGASSILLFIANLVITGVTYDLIKMYATKLWRKLLSMKIDIPESVNKVLIDDDDLNCFVTYIDEFHNKKISATPNTIKYIKEEIVADYFAKKFSEVQKREGREPNEEEIITIIREAYRISDDLLKKG